MNKHDLTIKIKKELFPTIQADVFINNERLAVEYDKKEIFYFNPGTGTIRTNYFNLTKIDTLKELFLDYLDEGDRYAKKT